MTTRRAPPRPPIARERATAPRVSSSQALPTDLRVPSPARPGAQGPAAPVLRAGEEPSLALLRERSAVEFAYHALKEAILGGEYTPGKRLVEEALAREFKVSRTPVREAIRRLQTERLVSRSPSGYVVADFTPEQTADIYATLAVLEGFAANLAAQTMLPRDHAKLRHIHRQFESAVRSDNLPATGAFNLQFHDEIVRSTRNETLIGFIEQLRDTIRRFRVTSLAYPGRPAAAVEEHARLLEAIVARDADAAEQVAREHMSRALEVRLLIEREGTPVPAPRAP